MGKSLTKDAVHAATAKEVEAQVRKDAAGLDPSRIEEIVKLIHLFGPSIYKVLLKIFHLIPKG